MHEILFYETANGNSPVYDFLSKLKLESKSKVGRIRFNKVVDYIQALSEYGTEKLNAKYTKHLEGDIWELRPIRDRILFAAVVNGKYVLLHQFIKKSQKTPKHEIEQAQRELDDYRKRFEKNG